VGPIAGSFSVSGVPNLIFNSDQSALYSFDELNNTTSNLSHNSFGSPFSYTIPSNDYTYVKVEIIAQSRIDVDTNAKVSFAWTITAGADSKTFTPKIIASNAAGTDGGGTYVDNYSFIYKGGGGGGSIFPVNISIQTQMSVANANIGAKILAFRVYGIDNYTFGAGPQGSQGLQGTFGPATIPLSRETDSTSLTVYDNGQFISCTGSLVFGDVFTTGMNVVIYNNTDSGMTIAGSVPSFRLAGTSKTGSRTLLGRGLATLLCLGSGNYIISGAGII
jgi:hypothetical protein